jgi:hypothetical protein
MKIVINTRPGGFSLSSIALRRLLSRKSPGCRFDNPDIFGLYKRNGRWHYDLLGLYLTVTPEGMWSSDMLDGVVIYNDLAWSWDHHDKFRADPELVSVVEDWREMAGDGLKIVAIPDGTDFIIVKHDDGSEHIAERHRTWA